MKLRHTLGPTIFFLSIFIIVGALLILLGINMITENGFAGPFMLLFLVGGLFIFMAIFAIISTFKKGVNKEDLKLTGQKCGGVVINIVPDYSTTLGGQHPQMAECHVVDSNTGETFTVKSEGYLTDLTRLLYREVDVYVDKYDRSKYYVDIEKLVAEYSATLNGTNVYDYRE